jgi:hypothetical protein
MEKAEFAYKEKSPKGSKVKVADLAFLKDFLATWKFYHKLETDQLKFADKVAKVKSVWFYHGGDVLYELKGVPGTWHEQCLMAAEQVGFLRRFFKY